MPKLEFIVFFKIQLQYQFFFIKSIPIREFLNMKFTMNYESSEFVPKST